MDKAVQNALNSLGDLVIQYPGPTFGVLVFMLMASITSLFIQLRRGAKITPQTIKDIEEMKKRARLDQIYADAFGDVLLELRCDDVIDRHEYKRACRRFGLAYRLGDLLTKKNDKRGRKWRIIRNCQEIHRTPSVVGKIPGPAIGEQVPYAPPKTAKVYVAVGKVLLRRKSAI